MLLHLPHAIQANGHDGDLQILREQADASLEREHFRRATIVDLAFRKNEQAVAAIGGLTGETKTFAKAGKLRQRKNIEERDDKKIAELPQPTLGEKPFVGRVVELAQGFSTHGDGQLMAKAHGKRKKNEAYIGATRNVVGNEKYGTS